MYAATKPYGAAVLRDFVLYDLQFLPYFFACSRVFGSPLFVSMSCHNLNALEGAGHTRFSVNQPILLNDKNLQKLNKFLNTFKSYKLAKKSLSWYPYVLINIDTILRENPILNISISSLCICALHGFRNNSNNSPEPHAQEKGHRHHLQH